MPETAIVPQNNIARPMIVGVDVFWPDDMAHQAVHKCPHFSQIINDLFLGIWSVLEIEFPSSLPMNLQGCIRCAMLVTESEC